MMIVRFVDFCYTLAKSRIHPVVCESLSYGPIGTRSFLLVKVCRVNINAKQRNYEDELAVITSPSFSDDF